MSSRSGRRAAAEGPRAGGGPADGGDPTDACGPGGAGSRPRRRDLLRVGLTGGLASGKSTVARLLATAGCFVADADGLVAQLYAPGQAGAAAVAAIFGAAALRPDGSVDPGWVASRVFGDPDARRRLEQAVHPLVRRRFADLLTARHGIAVLEATLLVEAGHAADFDFVVTVEAEADLRLARAVARGMDPQSARARLVAQGDGAARRAAAHRTLRNDGDLAALGRQVEALLADLRALQARRPVR